MNNLKSFKTFNESLNSNKNIIVLWDVCDMRGIPIRKKACIVDKDFNVLNVMDDVFGKGGEYTDEVKGIMNQYGVKGRTHGPDEDLYFAKMTDNETDLDPAEAVDRVKKLIDAHMYLKMCTAILK